MAGSPKRVGWDACAWIALIQKEKIRDAKGSVVEDRYTLARSVVELGAQGKIEIAVSGLCLAEVSKNPPGEKGPADKVGPFFEHDYILVVPVDTQVGTIARRLMQAGHGGLRPLDAVHLATAIVANVDELHTFDGRLLDLDAKLVKLDGTALKICKPAHGGAPMPRRRPNRPRLPMPPTQNHQPKRKQTAARPKRKASPPNQQSQVQKFLQLAKELGAPDPQEFEATLERLAHQPHKPHKPEP